MPSSKPVIPAQSGIQLIEMYPAKRDNITVLSASRIVLLLDSSLRGNDGAIDPAPIKYEAVRGDPSTSLRTKGLVKP